MTNVTLRPGARRYKVTLSSGQAVLVAVWRKGGRYAAEVVNGNGVEYRGATPDEVCKTIKHRFEGVT